MYWSQNNGGTGNRLLAYYRDRGTDRLLHHGRRPGSDSLWRRTRLWCGNRRLRRDGWGHQVRLLCGGALIDRVSLRHERVYGWPGEHPSGDPRQHQDSRTARHQSHHGATQTEHNSPKPCQLSYLSSLAA